MRVMLIDDHTLFRIGLRELLERRGIDVIADVADCQQGVQLVIESQPDIVLLDMRMPNMTGIQVLQYLRKHSQTMPIAILTTSREENDVVESLKSGAQGYLLKDMEPDDLISKMEQIVNGETIVAPELTAVLARAVQGGNKQQNKTTFSTLTPREREILCHLAEGQSNKVIAKILGISDGTVKLHVKGVLRKLSVHSRVEAAVLAVENAFCNKNKRMY